VPRGQGVENDRVATLYVNGSRAGGGVPLSLKVLKAAVLGKYGVEMAYQKNSLVAGFTPVGRDQVSRASHGAGQFDSVGFHPDSRKRFLVGLTNLAYAGKIHGAAVDVDHRFEKLNLLAHMGLYPTLCLCFMAPKLPAWVT